jgi:rhamnogalacturonan acetylesterase
MKRYVQSCAGLALLLAPALADAQVAGDFDPGTTGARVAAGASQSPRDGLPFTPTDFAAADPKLPTLYIAGDSTASTGNPAHRGWGAVLIDFLDTSKINVINRAIGGRSLRSYTAEGHWDEIVQHLKPGDWVIIEFGHNDGGDPALAKSRGDVPGIGDNIVTTTTPDGRTETVHSFGWYLRKYIRDAKAKGARPIVSTTTPRNFWDGQTRSRIERGMGQMRDWADQIARQEGALFIDHSNLSADALEKIGFAGSQAFFPADHTHTSTSGALLNAETLIAGLEALPGKPMAAYLSNKGRSIKPQAQSVAWKTFSPPAPVDGNSVRDQH